MGQVNANRKKFRGTLERGAAADGVQAQWQLVWSEPLKAKPGQRISKNRPPAPVHVLGFALDELREARLAPVVNFKGRGTAAAPDGA
jgi:ribosome maturation factor RimP